jgi:hypothetical protein
MGWTRCTGATGLGRRATDAIVRIARATDISATEAAAAVTHLPQKSDGISLRLTTPTMQANARPTVSNHDQISFICCRLRSKRDLIFFLETDDPLRGNGMITGDGEGKK